MNDLISIIIPVYNAEHYIDVCMESVLNQTYKDIEVILVNDASTDNSKEICFKYKENDNRVIVINKEVNEGAGFARNAGIDIAKGKYIMFVDSDDYIALNCVEELFNLLIKTQSDIAICLGQTVYKIEKNQDIENYKLDIHEEMNSEKAIEKLCYQKKILPGPWAKIFKRRLFNGIRFPNTGYEDLAVIYRLFDKAEKICFSPVEKYYYVQRSNNTTLGKFNDKKMDRIAVAEEMREFIYQNYNNLKAASDMRCFLAGIQSLNVLPYSMLNSSQAREIKKEICKYRKGTLMNKDAKAVTRIMALCSYCGFHFLKVLGSAYNIVRGGYRIKLK